MSEAYRGICNICGTKGLFERGTAHSTREGYPCPGCRASLRYRDQAAALIDEFGRGQTIFLRNMVSRGLLDNIAIYEPALRGPFLQHMRHLSGYTNSYYWPDVPEGENGPNGVRCENLERLTFQSRSFDVVITSDVMEHLLDIRAAFAEISRVLKPGGVHIFTIPNAWPFPDATEARVELQDGEEVHIKPARYHSSGDGTPCLVYHDYGADLIEMIEATGCRTQVVRRHGAVDPCYVNATFVSRKLA